MKKRYNATASRVAADLAVGENPLRGFSTTLNGSADG